MTTRALILLLIAMILSLFIRNIYAQPTQDINCVITEIDVGRRLWVKHWNGKQEWIEVPTVAVYKCNNNTVRTKEFKDMVPEGPHLNDRWK